MCCATSVVGDVCTTRRPRPSWLDLCLLPGIPVSRVARELGINAKQVERCSYAQHLSLDIDDERWRAIQRNRTGALRQPPRGYVSRSGVTSGAGSMSVVASNSACTATTSSIVASGRPGHTWMPVP